MTQRAFTDQDVVEAFPELAVHLPELGAGGFKVAFRAEAEDGSPCVLKILNSPDPDRDSFDLAALEANERFSREIVALNSVASPHVVSILRAPSARMINSSPHTWYLERYCDGGTLASRLTQGPLHPTEAKRVTKELLLAIEALWTSPNQIVHRDIKPSNIAFDADNRATLIDLGIAFFSTPSAAPMTGTFDLAPATRDYAAPEQFEFRRGQSMDFRTDLFALGVVAAEMLTGRNPFASHGACINYFNANRKWDVSVLDPFTSDTGFKNFIGRALDPRPSGRFRTIQLAAKTLGA